MSRKIVITSIFALLLVAAAGRFDTRFAPTAVAKDSIKKDATRASKAANTATLKTLPFSDRQSFKEAKRGFIAPLLNDGVVKNAEGRGIWDLRIWDFNGFPSSPS